MSRHLAWDGLLNGRDLGGLPAGSGRPTAFRGVVRSATLRSVTAAGWSTAVEYGVTRVVDLRTTVERAADPPAEPPVEVVHLSLLGSMTPTEYDEEVTRSSIGEAYVAMLERNHETVAAAVGVVADTETGTVLVHCQGGKDRTGLVCALLLELAGVARDEIVDDYGESGPRLADWMSGWIAKAETPVLRARRERMAAAPPEAMALALAWVDERWGGAEEYLRAGGLGDAQVARARHRLLG